MADARVVTCSTVINNTGQSDCSVDIGYVIGHVLAPRGTSFATTDAAKILANWTTLIQADSGTRIYPIPPSVFQEFTPNEAQYETLSRGNEYFLYTLMNKDRFKISAKLMTPIFLENMESLNNGIWGVFEITSNGYIIGKTSDGTTFEAVDADVRIEQQDKATSEAGAHLPYTVRIVNADDRTNFVSWVKPTAWNPATDLEGLLDVNLAVSGTPSATELIVTASTALNAKAVTGLVLADFLFTTSGTPDSVNESPDGTYTFTDTDLASGSVSLKAPSAMTTPGYEVVEPVAFVI